MLHVEKNMYNQKVVFNRSFHVFKDNSILT